MRERVHRAGDAGGHRRPLLGTGATAAAIAVYGLCRGVGPVVASLIGTALLAHGPRTLWPGVAALSAVLAVLHALHRAVYRLPPDVARGGRTERGGPW